jgi:hypothetical protein
MTESRYIVINKLMLTIFDECQIPIPYSHPIEGKKAALEWMMERGLQVDCKVIPEARFRALNGELPKDITNGKR